MSPSSVTEHLDRVQTPLEVNRFTNCSPQNAGQTPKTYSTSHEDNTLKDTHHRMPLPFPWRTDSGLDPGRRCDSRLRQGDTGSFGPMAGQCGGTIGTTGVNLNSETAIRDNIDLANGLLAGRGSSFRFALRNGTVYIVSGQDNPWYSINARNAQNKSDLEDAAKADKPTWLWHDDSINIYLNDSSSGWCSSPGNGEAIFVGAGAYQELLIHEMGHFLGLAHTHPNGDDGGVDD
jgi:hypothetical protein